MTEGKIIGIYIAEAATALPASVDKVRAVAHRGLEGDRYYQKTGTYSDREPKGPGREVTLIEQEALDYVEKTHGITLSSAESRRNILTSGVDLNALVGCKFKVGEVLVEGIRLCPPCGHLDELTGEKVLGALKDRGGLRANILTDGTIAVGDEISL